MQTVSNSTYLFSLTRLPRALLLASSAIFLLLLLPTNGDAQDSNYSAPRTVVGTPELQGMWTSNTITPFSRSGEFGDKLVENPEEAMQLELAVADYTAEQDPSSDPGPIPPARKCIQFANSYNNFLFNDRARVACYNVEFPRSLLIEPPKATCMPRGKLFASGHSCRHTSRRNRAN